MGLIIQSPPVKLIAAVMIAPSVSADEAVSVITNEWGVVDLALDWYAFDHSDYYAGEFGPSLKKAFFSFETLVDAETMPAVKIRSNRLEDGFCRDGKRALNIDPGYIADAKLIMPTTKNLSHRVYVGQGIYADQQLMYHGKTFNTMPWTFADYKQPAVIDFFNRVRRVYFDQLRTFGPLPVYG